MTWTLAIFICGCAVLAFIGWAIVAGGAARQVEDQPSLGYPWWLGGEKPKAAEPVVLPKAKRMRGPLMDGFCPDCREPGVYLTRTGHPNRRYHSLEVCYARVAAEREREAHLEATWPPAPDDKAVA
jgi:hypothetical protein